MKTSKRLNMSEAFKPKYIIGHWTGVNTYAITSEMKRDYHFIVGKDGEVVNGIPVTQPSKYGTGGMNSITLQIACAGGDVKAPLTPVQCEAFFKLCAQWLYRRDLKVDDFLTHAEVGMFVDNYLKIKTPKITDYLDWNSYLKQNIGKIDLTRLPSQYKATVLNHGAIIRAKINWYYTKFERIKD